MTPTQKILDKIRKLIRLAKGTSNPHEADTAWLMARKIATKYRVLDQFTEKEMQMPKDRDDDRRGRDRDRDDDRGSRGRDRDDDRRSSRGRDDDDRGSRSRDRDRDDDRSSARGKDRDDDRGGKTGGKFQYRERTAESVKKRANQTGGAFDAVIKADFPYFKPEAGTNEVRIMPPTWDDLERWGDHYGVELWIHRNIGADNGSYLCRNKMLGEDCALCDARREMERDGAPLDDINMIRPQKSVAVWIIDREEESAGPKVWTMGYTLDKEIASLSQDKKGGGILKIDHPNEGYDIEFTREGQSKRTRYSGWRIARTESPLSDDDRKQEKWLDYITKYPITETLQYFENEYLKKVWGGTGERRDRDVDDDRDRKGKGKDRDRDDDRRSSRGRDRDEDKDDDRGSRRGRDRDEKDDDKDKDDEDRGSRRRGRDDDEKDAKDEGRSSRGKKTEDLDDDIPSDGRKRGDREETDTRSRGRDDDDRGGSRRGRGDDDEDDKGDKGDKTETAAERAQRRMAERKSRR